MTSPGTHRRSPAFWAGLALLIIPVNFGVWILGVSVVRHEVLATALFSLFTVLALAQLVLGACALVGALRLRRAAGRGGIATAVLGLTAALGSVAGWAAGALLGAFAMGGGWGRPLRVRGRQVHPELREGADWTLGERPDGADLDAPTRRALEALWLHDAQKEHASVPAFSRVSWVLAAIGAPAELLLWSHRCALEEIAHARRCFALAAGYGGRSHTVLPMPELLHAGLELRGDAIEVLMAESLGDGCQLEDFNADIAAACVQVCEEPVTRAVLEQIAREERSHAEFSWAVVDWLLTVSGQTAHAALERALAGLTSYARPTAVSWHKRGLVARADAEELRRHGRLPDERWAELWLERLELTRSRAAGLIARRQGPRLALT